jgi:hypothetical protein
VKPARALRVIDRAVPVNRDDRFVTHYPTVMSRRKPRYHSGSKLEFVPALHFDAQARKLCIGNAAPRTILFTLSVSTHAPG